MSVVSRVRSEISKMNGRLALAAPVTAALAASLLLGVSVAPARADTVIAQVAVGGAASVEVNPVTNKIYVLNEGDDTVAVIDGAANTIDATVAVGAGNGDRMTLNPVTNKVYVANSEDGTITVIDGVRNTTATLNVTGSLAVNTVTNKIYVARNDSITVIDGATNGMLTIPGPGGGGQLGVNSVTNKIYVPNGDNTVTVIDGATNTTTSIDTAIAGSTAPYSATVNDVTNKIYIADAGDDGRSVTVIDGATNTTTTVALPNHSGETGKVAVNRATNKIYVPDKYRDKLTVIDGATNTTTTMAVGDYPDAVAVNDVSNKIYVSNRLSGTVTVIDGATNANFTLPTGGLMSSDVAVNPDTNRIYVATDWNTVTVIDGTDTPGVTTVGSTTAYSATAATAVALVKPSGTTAGDILVATITADLNPTMASVPSGWTPIVNALSINSTSRSGARVFAYWHVVNSSSAVSYSWTLSKAVMWGAGLTAYRGVNTTTPLDTNVITAVNSSYTNTSISVPSITTTSNGAMLIGAVGFDSRNPIAVPPRGWNEQWQAAGGQIAEQADMRQATAGASGTATWTFHGERAVAAWRTALKPAATQAPPTAGVTAVSSSTASAATAATGVGLTRPSGSMAGDVLVASITADLNPSMASLPSGWTPIVNALSISSTSTSGARVFAYYHVVGPSEPASYAWTLSKAVKWGAGVTAYRGVNNTTPLDSSVATAVNTTYKATSITVPSITTASNDAMLIGGLGFDSTNPAATPPSGWTERWETLAGGQIAEQADKTKTAAGASGTATWTFSAPKAVAAWRTALKPAR